METVQSEVMGLLRSWSPDFPEDFDHLRNKVRTRIRKTLVPAPGQPTMAVCRMMAWSFGKRFHEDFAFDWREPMFEDGTYREVVLARAQFAFVSILEMIDAPRVAAEAAQYIAAGE